jgi:hypothetical protein
MQTPDYDSFAQKCAEEQQLIQAAFHSDYNINNYENWFYNQATGLLTFSTGNNQINFSYIEVGTFSENTKTWKWSWDNEHTLEKVKEQIALIKEFGETYDYPKLTNGYFPSDEYEAWEFTAIALKLTNGIGVYRPVADHLKIFMVITGIVDNETARSIKSKYVECEEHDYRRRAFVCRHLNHEDKVGFEEYFDTFEGMELGLEEDDDFMAWCNECEKVRQQEGEWNDTSMEFADIKLVCEKCYFEMKELNLGHR